jgi:arylsulfatase A-like enzyme
MRKHLDRGTFLQRTAAGMSALASPMLWSGCQKKIIERRSNVLFIVIDDLNSWVGCFRGHPDMKTPNINRPANKGMLFEYAYCSPPLCNPKRSSILTRLRSSLTGIYGNQKPLKMAFPNIPSKKTNIKLRSGSK